MRVRFVVVPTVVAETAAPAGSTAGPRRSWLPRWPVAVIAVLSAPVAVLLFGAGGRDDDYITFWEAQQLADHGSLVNVNGAHVEQSSSLAHVVLLAILNLVTRVSFPLLAVIVGAVCLTIAICGAARVAEQLREGAGTPTAIACALFYPLLYWATGGLETLLAAVAVAWFVLAMSRALLPGAARSTWLTLLASSVLMESVRPDTLIVAVAAVIVAAGADALSRRSASVATWMPVVDGRNARRVAGTVVGVGVALTLFRLIYFRSVLPQPDLSKSGGLAAISQGARYLGTALPWWLAVPLLVAFVAGFVTSVRQRRTLGVVAALVVALGVGSTLFTRGDWMGGARLFVPYLPVAIALAVVGALSVPGRTRRAGVLFPIAGLVVVIAEVLLLVAFVTGSVWLSPTRSGASRLTTTAIPADTGAPIWSSWRWPGHSLPVLPWYMADNSPRERDAVFLREATPLLRALIAAEPRGDVVTIGSGQAGYVLFTWENDFPGRLRFYDTANVVTSDLEHCPGLQPAMAGDVMTYNNWAKYAGGCAPPLPDIIFDVGSYASSQALERYYHLVVSDSVTIRRTWLGTTVQGGGLEFMAVLNTWNP